MIILNVVLNPVGGPSTAYTRLGYATPSRGLVSSSQYFLRRNLYFTAEQVNSRVARR